ncbi:hypothetical protein ACFXKG_08185 [Streptomyces sp. NPDC059255]|uniref:hypothetical protein n=1 Tax=Streptomyces sp. NPDC059255 TaxID=3346793 RepID=UPI003683FD84
MTGERTGTGWASLMGWRSTHGGWLAQHLVSTGTAAIGRAVLLQSQSPAVLEGVTTQQNWFRPGNRFAARAFGGMIDRLGSEATVIPGEYVMVPLALARSLHSGPARAVVELDGGASPELAELARRARGELYVRSEELDQGDLRLAETDWLYRLVGLRRHRRIWVRQETDGRLLGAAVAYRGPLGLNFSFLENRCDLLVAPDQDPQEADRTVRVLTAAVRAAYEDFEPGAVPMTLTGAAAPLLTTLGAEPVQPYSQGIWTADAAGDWQRHIDALYRQRSGGRLATSRSAA